jgi:hypothetical protein
VTPCVLKEGSHLAGLARKCGGFDKTSRGPVPVVVVCFSFALALLVQAPGEAGSSHVDLISLSLNIASLNSHILCPTCCGMQTIHL